MANTSVLFKTIMCPLKDKCPKVRKNRWPSSSLKTITQFGAMCPYAHHLMELEFPETIQSKINATKAMSKTVKSSQNEKVSQRPFYLGSVDTKIKKPSDDDLKRMEASKKKLAALVKRRDDPSLKTYIDEVKEINKKIMGCEKGGLQVDENYCKKFGLLKKASVLSYYGRVNEAFNEVAKAVEIIKQQKTHETTKYEAIQRRWKFKLGLDEGFELPFPLDKVHPDDIDNKMLK